MDDAISIRVYIQLHTHAFLCAHEGPLESGDARMPPNVAKFNDLLE